MFALGQGTKGVDFGARKIHVTRPTSRTRELRHGPVGSRLALAFIGLEQLCWHDQTLRAALLTEPSNVRIDDCYCGLQCACSVITASVKRTDLTLKFLD